MKAGRKNLKRDALGGVPEQPQEGHVLMRAVGLRGSNVVEAENDAGENTLCILPAKFQKTIWIKTGSFVFVDEADREKAIDAGSKVTGTITKVLLEDQVKVLRKSAPWWPKSFGENQKGEVNLKEDRVEEEEGRDNLGEDGSDDNDLPPIEANANRQHAMSMYEESESDSCSDDESLEVDRSEQKLR